MSNFSFFKTDPEEIDRKDSRALSRLELEMGTAMLRKKVVQVNGPYAVILPPVEKGGPSRIQYMASILYEEP